jgi:O-glycosyl hydrolase
MVRIDVRLLDGNETVSEERHGLLVSAYADKSIRRQVIVLVNRSEVERVVAIPSATASTLTTYVTSATLDLQKQAAGQHTVPIPRRSVVTVVVDEGSPLTTKPQ